MLYIFYGQDAFSRRESLAGLKASLNDDGMLESSTSVLDGRQVTPEEVMAACDTVPFLASHRLVIVEGLLKRFEGSGPTGRGRRRRRGEVAPDQWEFWRPLADYVERLPPSTTLVLVDEGLSPGNSLLAALRPRAQVREFRPLHPRALPDWIRERARQLGLNLAPGAVRLLADLVGNNLWMLASELDKLSAYAAGQRLAEDDVRALVAAAREVSVFAMVDAIVESRPAAATRLLRQLIAQGASSAFIFAMIVRQYRLLVRARDLLDAGATSAHVRDELDIRSDFLLERLLEQAERYTLPRLKAAYRRLLEADAAIKRGIHSEELALELLIHDLAAPIGPGSAAQARSV